MKVVFAGSSSFSIPSLEVLIKKKQVVAVLTVPDKPAGRGLVMQMSPVKMLAQAHNIPVLQPESLRVPVINEMKKYNPDVLVCASYGKIFGPMCLSLFKKGTINVHPSLLPRFRGAAPIPATILAGDIYTGVTLQKISQDMDCGDVVLQSTYQIDDNDTTETLEQVLSKQGGELLDQLFSDFEALYCVAKPQSHQDSVYCGKITPAMGQISGMESAKYIALLIRALAPPYSGVKVQYQNKLLKLWKGRVFNNTMPQDSTHIGKVLGVQNNEGILVQCRRGILLVEELQLAGKKRIAWNAFIAGNPSIVGATLF